MLTYSPVERDRWKRAKGAQKRALIPPCCHLEEKGLQMVERQASYHFGEMATARHFNELDGWLAFRFYVLSYQPDFENPRFVAGGRQIQRMFLKRNLEALIAARGEGRTDTGEPDLFLYKPTGERMFLECKVDSDKLHASGSQLQCLAQIRSILGCRAEVVQLVPEGKEYKPRIHWVEPATRGTIPRRHGHS